MARAQTSKKAIKARPPKATTTKPSAPPKAKGRVAKAGAKKSPATFKLYWCETDDHGEDWFIVARSAASACRIHEDEEGYDRGDADAELICELPASLQKKAEPGWPSTMVLEGCGAELVAGTGEDERPRIVRIKGRVFGEGDVFELATARAGQTPKH